MPNHQTVHRARCRGSSKGQYVEPGGSGVNVDTVVDLLESVATSGHPAVRRYANSLLETMAMNDWRVASGPKKGGLGGGRYLVDENYHITIAVKITRTEEKYHLQLTRAGYIRAITGDAEMDLNKPYVPPGAWPSARE